MKLVRKNSAYSLAVGTLALAAWVLVWAALTHFGVVSTALLPSPTTVIGRMFERDFFYTYILSSIPRTFAWVLSAWILGILVTGLFAYLAVRIGFVSSALKVIFVSGRALPSVIAIPLFAAIMGSGRLTVATCAIFMVVSYSESSFQESFRAVSRTFIAMKETLDLSRRQELLLIYLPGIAYALRAIAVQSFGIALVVTVGGEMILSFQNTIGYDVANMSWLLQMINMYAVICWLVICSLLVRLVTDLLPALLEFPGKYIIKKRALSILGSIK